MRKDWKSTKIRWLHCTLLTLLTSFICKLLLLLSERSFFNWNKPLNQHRVFSNCQLKINVLDFFFRERVSRASKCFCILKERRFKPVGEVFLLRRSGTLSSSLCRHRRFHSQHNYQPRNPRARCLCRPSDRRLLFDELGANFSCRCFRGSYRQFHQWLLELSTLRHWRWNTTVCSNDDSRRDAGSHWKTLAARYRQTSCRRGIPVQIDCKTETETKTINQLITQLFNSTSV